MQRIAISAMFLVAGSAAVASYVLFPSDDVRSTANADIRVLHESPVSANKMARFYDITFKINGNDIRTRLTKTNHFSNSSSIPDDWAAYTSHKPHGIFIVRRRHNTTNVIIDGHVIFEGALYVIQPHDQSGGHVIHGQQNESRIEKDASKIDEKRLLRIKRDLKEPFYYKVAIMIDEEAFARARVGGVSERAAEFAIKQMVTMAAMFVELCFRSFHNRIKIDFVTTEIDILPGNAETDEDHKTVDGIRKTACAEKMLKFIDDMPAHFWQKRDHVLLLTGFDLLNLVGDNSIRGMSNYGSMCSPKSVTIVEFSFTMDMARLMARYVVGSIGAKMDSPKGPHKNYIMTHNARLSPYEAGSKLWEYSEETKDHVQSFLSRPPRGITKTCLKPAKDRKVLSLPSSTIAEAYTYNDQCQFGGYKNAVDDQPAMTICEDGIKCLAQDESQVVIMPMFGTPCGASNRGKCHWRHCVMPGTSSIPLRNKTICVGAYRSPTRILA